MICRSYAEFSFSSSFSIFPLFCFASYIFRLLISGKFWGLQVMYLQHHIITSYEDLERENEKGYVINNKNSFLIKDKIV